MTAAPAAVARVRRAVGDHATLTLLALSAGWATVQTGRRLLPPFLPEIIAALSITPFAAGLLLSAMGAVYALAQYPSGRLSDGLSRGTLVVPGLVLVAVGFATVGAAPAYAVLVAGGAAIGVGRAAFSIPARARIADLFEERRARALGVFTACADVGGLSASAVAVAALAVATWRAPFLPVAAALVAVALLVDRWNREPYTATLPSLAVRATAGRLAGADGLPRLLVAYSLFRFVVRGLTGFLPAFLRSATGLSPTLATAGFAVLFVVGIPAKPLGGLLGDRIGRTAVTAGGLSVATVALGGLLVADGPVAALASVALLAAGYKAVFPVMDAFFMAATGDGDAGADLGAVRAVGTGVASAGPAYVGYVAGRIDYTAAFAGLAVVLVASAALFALAGRSTPNGS